MKDNSSILLLGILFLLLTVFIFSFELNFLIIIILLTIYYSTFTYFLFSFCLESCFKLCLKKHYVISSNMNAKQTWIYLILFMLINICFICKALYVKLMILIFVIYLIDNLIHHYLYQALMKCFLQY